MKQQNEMFHLCPVIKTVNNRMKFEFISRFYKHNFQKMKF